MKKFETMPRKNARSRAASASYARRRKEKALQANLHLLNDTNAVEGWKDDNLAETFASGGESLNHGKKAEESKILLLASDVQKLEKYLSFEMEKIFAKLKKSPSGNGSYYHLSVLTAAKIILFNKPRANRAMQLTVAAFSDKSSKLDTLDETVQCLSSVEKKLCDRLHVVKTVTKDGKTSPILLTPCTKKAMELLAEQTPNFIEGILTSSTLCMIQVFNTVAKNVQLENPGLLTDAKLQEHVAFISQVIAMQDSELEWLTSHIANSLATEEDLHKISTLEMSKVLQFLHGIDCGQPQVCTDETAKSLQLSDAENVVEPIEESQPGDFRGDDREPVGSVARVHNSLRPETYMMKKISYQENVSEVLVGVHACVFCDFILGDMKQHLLSRHKDEKEVIEALTSPVPTAFEELILWGDHRHNVKVFQKKQGVLFVLQQYRKHTIFKKTKSPVDYIPCPDCLAYVFYAEFLSHRHRFCLLKKKEKRSSNWAVEKRRGLFPFTIANIDIKGNDLSHLATLMLSDLVTVSPKSDNLITEYEESIMAAEGRMRATQVTNDRENCRKLSSHFKESDSETLRQLLNPSKFAIIFRLIKWLCNPLRQKDTSKPHISRMFASELILSLKACASHLKDKAKTEMDNITLVHRVEKYLSLFGSMSSNISVQAFSQQTSHPVQCSPTTELTEILPLASDILKLEAFLNSEMQKEFENITIKLDFRCYGAYFALLEITAAKVFLLNKSRAKDVVMLKVASYKETTAKLDPLKDIAETFSGVEKKLCDRLVVVPTPNKDRVMVPILLTPKLKTALDLLVETRINLRFHSPSPYVFSKSSNENLDVDELLQKFTARAELGNPHFFLRMEMHKYIATACQIIAMEDDELDWIKSQMVDFTGDIYAIQTSAIEMAKAVKHFCGMDGEKTDTSTYNTSEINVADATSSISAEMQPGFPDKDCSNVSSDATAHGDGENSERQEGESSNLQKDATSSISAETQPGFPDKDCSNVSSDVTAPDDGDNSERQEGESSNLLKDKDTGVSRYRRYEMGHRPLQRTQTATRRMYRTSRKGSGTEQSNFIQVLSDATSSISAEMQPGLPDKDCSNVSSDATAPDDGENSERQEGESSNLQKGDNMDTGVSRYRRYEMGHGPCQRTQTATWRMYRTSRKGSGTEQSNFIEVLSGMHSCVFCGILLCDITEHLLQFHRHEREVLEAQTEVPLTFEVLIRRGDYHHNVKVLQRRYGTLLVLKFCVNTKSPEDYMPCPGCLAYVFYAEFLSHRQDCKVVTRKGSECDKTKADLDGAPQSKRVKRTLSAVEVSNIVKTKALRNLVILMLSDAVAMLPKSSRSITLYEETMVAAERRPKPFPASSEFDEIVTLVAHLKKSYPICLKESLNPTKFHIIFQLVNWLCEHSKEEDMLQPGVLNQKLVSELGHCLKACASLMKDEVGAGENKNALLCRVEKYLSVFDSMTRDVLVQALPQQIVYDIPVQASLQTLVHVSPQQIAAPVQPEINLHKTLEFAKILLLTKDILQLEKYLNLKMEEGFLKLTRRPTVNRYFFLLAFTAAKLVLFNKPRAKEVVMMTVASYKDSADKLDLLHGISGCLSSTERKLCERLVVVQTPNEVGVMVPILITPRIKTALDLLLQTRSLLVIHPVNSYLFAKDRKDYLKVCELLSAVSGNVQLQKPELLLSMNMDNYVATICQTFALNDGEMDWLKSHPITFGKDVRNLTASALNMATVVELLCEKDRLKTPEPHIAGTSSAAESTKGPTASKHSYVFQSANNSSISEDDQPEIPQNLETSDLRNIASVDISNMEEYADEPVEEKYSDVLRRTNALEQPEEDESVIIITVDEEKHEEDDKSVVKMSVDFHNIIKGVEEPPEEKYSDVLRRDNIPDTVEDAEELPEEKYSDVLRRENRLNIVEDGEELSQEKYSDVLKRGEGAVYF